MKKIISLLILLATVTACADEPKTSESVPVNKNVTEEKEIKEEFKIDDVEFEYERAFTHNLSGVTLQVVITNKSDHDIKIQEVTDLATTGAQGFELNHDNSYSFNGDTLESGAKEDLALLYFNDNHSAQGLNTIKPDFEVKADGETYKVEGKQINVE